MSIQASLNQISRSLAAGDLHDAERHCRAALQADDRNVFVYLNLAKIAYQKRSFDEADGYLRQASRLDPGNANVPAQHCEVLRRLERHSEAEQAARRALRINPDNIDAKYNLSVLYLEMRRRPEAIELLESIVARDAGHEAALHNLGVLHDQGQDLDSAERYYRQSVSVNPGNSVARRNLASLLFDRGLHDESRALYAELIEDDPDDVDAHFAYARLVTYGEDDPHLRALERLAPKINELPREQQVKACFTVGKANQDLGRYAPAFDAFRFGNELHYSRHPYDERSNFRMLDDVVRSFDAEFFERTGRNACADDTPIFVLGMPRSGSTLVEQILATHGKVAAAGEVKYLKQAIQEHLIGDRQTFANSKPSWTQSSLHAAARQYLSNLQRHGCGAARVVDKMPGNYAFIGIIAALFPNAKIVHTVRHPMATLWSNYSTHFGDALHYTYRLDVLTRYFRKYRDVMRHWASVLPAGTIHNVDYERLVHEPERVLGELFDYLHLPWEPRCLDFHTTRRVIRTASVVQVQKPVYTSAVSMWCNYRNQLSQYEMQLETG